MFFCYVIIYSAQNLKKGRRFGIIMAGKYSESDRSVNANNYTEFTVKRAPSPVRLTIKAFLILVYIGVVVGLWLVMWWLGAISALVVAALCYFTWPYTNVEYEYTTSSGEWRFVRILGGRKRMPVLEVKIKDMKLIAPYTEEIKNELSCKKVYDFRKSPKQTEDVYCAVFDEDGEDSLILFQCTNKALAIFKYYNRENTVDCDSLHY